MVGAPGTSESPGTLSVRLAYRSTQTVRSKSWVLANSAQKILRLHLRPVGRGVSPMPTVTSTVGWMFTDPEPDMEMRQAHIRNMRSKCRCSCVLQFTRHHGVSSVLHRPPSQMIHCIVLCCLILRLASRDCLTARERRARLRWAPHSNRGRSQTRVEARAL